MADVQYRPPRSPPRPPPPPAPPNRLPPPERLSWGFASFTVSDRPSSCVPFRALMAFFASSGVHISTKPNPRDCPVYLSVISLPEVTEHRWACRYVQLCMGNSVLQ